MFRGCDALDAVATQVPGIESAMRHMYTKYEAMWLRCGCNEAAFTGVLLHQPVTAYVLHGSVLA